MKGLARKNHSGVGGSGGWAGGGSVVYLVQKCLVTRIFI